MRYIKQQRKIDEVQRFTAALEEEDKKRKAGLNVQEKIALYHQRVEDYSKSYDKEKLNDANLNFDMLMDKKYYRELNKYRSLTSRMLYTMPWYARRADVDEVSMRHKALRIIGPVLMLLLGYRLGMYQANEENELYAKSKLVQFESEDQIFDMLFNKGKEAVFLHFYTPGHQEDRKMYNLMEKESSRPEYADFVFMSVHCRKHLNFCMSKYHAARSVPMAELYYINE